ncbi:ATP-dependent nuclease [Citrobacter portucalensis]|uniref:ATP-dependent nuclease n=1 Tax=Citrobacter portucalensis TaxID=1639133 RepID=UPI001299D7DB|nr:AAA family ATPase [Citrobacter portucalensis]MRF59228.1 AAA family ATPase [Citrobacter portucalensis]
MSNIPHIKKITIKNFGCIGSNSVELDIDKIVILVGPNNAGKSTILRAYEAVTESSKLNIDDFHNKDLTCIPEIIVHSIASVDNKPGDEWCDVQENDTYLVQERWRWIGMGTEPERIGYNTKLKRWAEEGDAEKMPWGMNNLAKAKRPKPHRVNTFDDPDIQSKAIVSLLKSLLEEDIKNISSSDDNDTKEYDILVGKLKTLRDSSKTLQEENIRKLENNANSIIGKIFPNHGLRISAPPSKAPIKIDLLGDEFSLEMGVEGGVAFPLEKQGSGSRRTALWTILKLLADSGFSARSVGSKAKSFHEKLGENTSHILLLDEPEVSLHPLATAMARDVLYSLPDNDNWQVMVATHSPSFIDLTKNHTTIIRVDKSQNNDIKTTTLFKPSQAKLTDSDKENLKLINLFDSHISEAFFGGRVIIVEGDTEYSAFNHIKNTEASNNNLSYQDLNIIRARGKVTVASMMKVLNHFGNEYYVLHDTDIPKIKSKRKNRELSKNGKTVYDEIIIQNPAWTNNEKILGEKGTNSRVVASLINFESAYFDETVGSDKPENCLKHLKESPEHYEKIKKLLDGILDPVTRDLPDGSTEWSSMNELQQIVEARLEATDISGKVIDLTHDNINEGKVLI